MIVMLNDMFDWYLRHGALPTVFGVRLIALHYQRKAYRDVPQDISPRVIHLSCTSDTTELALKIARKLRGKIKRTNKLMSVIHLGHWLDSNLNIGTEQERLDRLPIKIEIIPPSPTDPKDSVKIIVSPRVGTGILTEPQFKSFLNLRLDQLATKIKKIT